MKWPNYIWSWLRSLFSNQPKPYDTVRVEELPDRLRERTVYLVGEGKNLWVAAMTCPCGCNETIQLNLLAGRRPKWSVSETPNYTVSLHPSVWRKSGCKSHFFFRNSEIIWCDDHPSGGTPHAA